MIGVKRIDFNGMLFAGYLFFVWASYFFENRYNDENDKRVFIVSLVVGAIIIIVVAFLIMKLVRRIHILVKEFQYNKKASICLITCSFCFNLAIFLLWFIAYFPGGCSPDSVSQYGQAFSGKYNDWHPVLHTLIFFTIPLKLTGQTASVVLFQIIYFSGLLAYLNFSISRYFGIKTALVVNAYIIFNPYTGSIAMYPWKDVGFAMAALLVAVYVFNIYYSSVSWIKKPLNFMLLVISLAFCTVFRHNAILYTFFVIISLCVYCGKTIGLRLAFLTFMLIILIKGPVYNLLNVEAPGGRHTEIMGVPLTIMANSAKEGAEGLEEDTKDFLFKIASPEAYKERYIVGNFNYIKSNGADTTIVDQTSISEILSMTLECILKHPGYSAMAFFKLTDMVYALDGGDIADITPSISGNEYGIEYKGMDEIVDVLDNYKWSVDNSPLRVLRYIGSTIFLMLLFILGKCSLADRHGIKKILLCIPILIYDFGTMLLLTGSDNRFFFVNFLICPIIILITLGEFDIKAIW